MVNRIKTLIFLLSLSSCSSFQEKSKQIKYEYPPDNPYPTIMKKAKSSEMLALLVELKPKSLKFDCTLRNDSPYYWCGVDGVIQNPDPKLPKKVGTTYHRVVNLEGKKVSENLIKRLKKANKPVFLVTPRSFHIDDNEFGNLMFGIYNEDECMNLFHDYSTCPGTSKKLNIFTGKYE